MTRLATVARSWVHSALATTDTDVTANQTSRNEVNSTGSGANEDTNGSVAVGTTAMNFTDVGALAVWTIGAFEVMPEAAFGNGNFRG